MQGKFLLNDLFGCYHNSKSLQSIYNGMNYSISYYILLAIMSCVKIVLQLINLLRYLPQLNAYFMPIRLLRQSDGRSNLREVWFNHGSVNFQITHDQLQLLKLQSHNRQLNNGASSDNAPYLQSTTILSHNQLHNYFHQKHLELLNRELVITK